MNAAGHCEQLVRGGDKDRFLSALFAPDEKRPHLLALYAFNLEIARIAKVVSEPHIGLIRQQWWHETIDGIYGGHASDHPVAAALAAAISAAHLPSQALHDLVGARECELHADPFTSLDQLEAYLGGTSSALIQLAALILVGPRAGQASEAAGLAGVAFGLAQLLRDPARERFLPPGMDHAAHALRRWGEARKASVGLPSEVLPAFLHVTLTGLYLKQPQPSQFRRQFAMWWAARRERF